MLWIKFSSLSMLFRVCGGGGLCGLKIFMHRALTGCMYLACLACFGRRNNIFRCDVRTTTTSQFPPNMQPLKFKKSLELRLSCPSFLPSLKFHRAIKYYVKNGGVSKKATKHVPHFGPCAIKFSY